MMDFFNNVHMLSVTCVKQTYLDKKHILVKTRTTETVKKLFIIIIRRKTQRLELAFLSA